VVTVSLFMATTCDHAAMTWIVADRKDSLHFFSYLLFVSGNQKLKKNSDKDNDHMRRRKVPVGIACLSNIPN
jgi:hypothetical protein